MGSDPLPRTGRKLKDGACLACHQGKAKCSMALPSCERCLLYGITCRYLNPGEYFHMLQGTAEDIEVELDCMEEEIASLKNRASMTNAAQETLGNDDDESVLEVVMAQNRTMRRLSKQNNSRSDSSTGTTIVQHRHTNQTIASGKPVNWSVRISPRRFTIQTNLRNITDIQNLFSYSLSGTRISSEFNLHATTPSSDSSSTAVTLPRNQLFFRKFGKDSISPIIDLYLSLPNLSISILSSPMRFVIDNCIDVYFECFNNKAPILHRRSFTTHYRTIPDPLNSLVALSMATWTSEHALIFHGAHVDRERATHVPEYFFHRASAQLMEVFDEPHVSTVYALAFLMQYRLYNPDPAKPTQAHSFYSLAVRFAQQLGLFSGCGGDQPLVLGQSRDLQRESTIRLGWLLYHWDFDMFAVGFPAMLRDLAPSVAPRELDVEDEDERAILAFFVHNGRSRDLAWKVMTTLYENEEGKVPLTLVTGLERELEAWYAEMPEQFRADRLDACGPRIRPLAVSNQASYHHLSIDLHKQFIPKSAEAIAAATENGYTFQLRSLQVCVEAAWRLNGLFIDLCERGETHDVFLGTFIMTTEILSKIVEYQDLASGDDGVVMRAAKWHLSKHLAVVKESVAFQVDWRPWRTYAKYLEEFLVQHEVPLEYWITNPEDKRL
ncbi:hypothetical protein BC938DRAFT_481006 [Jimgerdemannia flammicorona]|uniref:Zn(2)-C6 fungal-type domain-containing protein n=1 Tax=Jimgerdemannia flammicorona TaxID=994334 RepID=A0A433QX73_9FUNG|nr:hypothetical protein BC938DRAFT_481006 [Jimgerdemannia flammicorona]